MAKETLQIYRWLDENGREIPDPIAVEVPAGFKRPETLQEQIRRLVRSEQFNQSVSEQGMETFEEAEDFEIDDDMFDPHSPYEEVFDPILGRGITLQEFHENQGVYEKRFIKAEQEAYKKMELSEALRARPKAGGSRAASERDNSEGIPGGLKSDDKTAT